VKNGFKELDKRVIGIIYYGSLVLFGAVAQLDRASDCRSEG
jgi:hypothetical protein